MFKKRKSRRDELIDAVVEAWNGVKTSEKVELIGTQPDLYFAVARLAAYETVSKEMRQEYGRTF